MLLFQHIEHLLKLLMAGARIDGPSASLHARLEERRSRAHRQALGQLAGPFADDVLVEASDREAPAALGDLDVLRLHDSTHRAFVEQHQTEMKTIVEAHSELIHQFLPWWSPASEESTRRQRPGGPGVSR